MPPTKLTIATSSITRLLKEESSYRTELASQEKSYDDLLSGALGGNENDDGNLEFRIRQEVCLFFLLLSRVLVLVFFFGN